MTRAVRHRAGIVVIVLAALACCVAGCSGAGTEEGVGSTAYDTCPDAMVDAWLSLGRDDGQGAAELDRTPSGPGDLPVGEARVACSIALTHPEDGAVFTLSVLAGSGATPRVVAAVAEAQGSKSSPRARASCSRS